jgi:hypothetical protein
MSLNFRYLAAPSAVLRHYSGRAYVANSLGIVDIPPGDAEAIHSAARLMLVGNTSDRPSFTDDRQNWPPRQMYDLTLSKVIFPVAGSNPVTWVDITGAAV